MKNKNHYKLMQLNEEGRFCSTREIEISKKANIKDYLHKFEIILTFNGHNINNSKRTI